MQMNYSVPVCFNPGEKRRLVYFITRASCAQQLVAEINNDKSLADSLS